MLKRIVITAVSFTLLAAAVISVLSSKLYVHINDASPALYELKCTECNEYGLCIDNGEALKGYLTDASSGNAHLSEDVTLIWDNSIAPNNSRLNNGVTLNGRGHSVTLKRADSCAEVSDKGALFVSLIGAQAALINLNFIFDDNIQCMDKSGGNSINFGLICGSNYGKIADCTFTVSGNFEFLIYNNVDLNFNFGGAVGLNYGIISAFNLTVTGSMEIIDTSASATVSCGALAGINTGSITSVTIERCELLVIAEEQHTGGIAGTNENVISFITLVHCQVNIDVAGGITGKNSGRINCVIVRNTDVKPDSYLIAAVNIGIINDIFYSDTLLFPISPDNTVIGTAYDADNYTIDFYNDLIRVTVLTSDFIWDISVGKNTIELYEIGNNFADFPLKDFANGAAISHRTGEKGTYIITSVSTEYDGVEHALQANFYGGIGELWGSKILGRATNVWDSVQSIGLEQSFVDEISLRYVPKAEQSASLIIFSKRVELTAHGNDVSLGENCVDIDGTDNILPSDRELLSVRLDGISVGIKGIKPLKSGFLRFTAALNANYDLTINSDIYVSPIKLSCDANIRLSERTINSVPSLITVTAHAPGAGHSVKGIRIGEKIYTDGVGNDSVKTFQISVSAAIPIISAVLERTQYTAEWTKRGNGNVSVSDSTPLYGDRVTFTARAESGYKFMYWQATDGRILSQSAEYTLTVIDSIRLTAVFIPENETELLIHLRYVDISGASDICINEYTVTDSQPLNREWVIAQSATVDYDRNELFAEFTGWTIDEERSAFSPDGLVTGNVVLKPCFTATRKVSITINGVLSRFDFNTRISLVGSNDFSAWKVNGEIYSREKYCSVSAIGDLTIIELTHDVENNVGISIGGVYNYKDAAYFTVNHTAGNYKAKGILLSSIGAADSDFNIQSTSTLIMQSYSAHPSQFILRNATVMSFMESLKVRAFLIMPNNTVIYGKIYRIADILEY